MGYFEGRTGQCALRYVLVNLVTADPEFTFVPRFFVRSVLALRIDFTSNRLPLERIALNGPVFK